MITPSDSPSAPAEYDAVPVQDMNIQAPQADLGKAFNAATSVAGPDGPRQAQSEALLSSPQGFASDGYNIDAGGSAGWSTDVEPSG